VDCDKALTLLSAQLDREIQPEERPVLESHLAECPNCRSASDAFRLQDADLRRAFASRREAAARVAERVIGRLPARRANGRGQLRWLPMVLAAAAGFLLAVGIFGPWQKPPDGTATAPPTQIEPKPEPMALLTLATGAVEVLLPGKNTWELLPGGSAVAVGASVRTPSQVRCTFRTTDGSEVRLNAGTEVRFDTGRRLALAKGQILANVAKAQAPFEVQVADATVQALGTQFGLWSQPAETTLVVLEGSTRVRGPGAESVVETGEAARIVKGQVTEKRRGEDLLQQTRWLQEILAIRPDDPKLAQFVEDELARIGQGKAEFLNEEEIRSLGASCALPLTRFIESPRSRTPAERDKRIKAARILADMAQPWSVPDLIKMLSDDDPDVRACAAQGLERLTSKTMGCPSDEWRGRQPKQLEGNVKEWQDWWQRNKDRYPSPP
jgi:ferric-dicitrate binding protein FerR (iron transport regulator)